MILTDELLTGIHESLREEPGDIDARRIARVAHSHGLILDRASLLDLTDQVRHHLEGLGPLHDLATDGVSDILVNPDGSVWIDSLNGLERTSLTLSTHDARALATRLASLGNRRLDDAMPWADAQLPGNLRFHGMLPPLSVGGASISLRRAATLPYCLDDLENSGTLTATGRALVDAIIRARLSFLVSGGTGSGKTTLLGAMLGAVDPRERIIIVEDSTELRPTHPHVVHLQARHANAEGMGEISLATLIRQCLRMRPDRIIVGECRGADIRELLQALNTGHEGGCGTLHANTAADVPARLEALGALAGLDPLALASQALSAITVVLHMHRSRGGRALSTISLLQRGKDGRLECVPAVSFGTRERRFPAFDALEARLGHGGAR